MNYTIVDVYVTDAEFGAEKLEHKVFPYVRLGWQPCGGVCAVRSELFAERFDGAEPGTWLMQAMTHPDADAPYPSLGDY